MTLASWWMSSPLPRWRVVAAVVRHLAGEAPAAGPMKLSRPAPPSDEDLARPLKQTGPVSPGK